MWKGREILIGKASCVDWNRRTRNFGRLIWSVWYPWEKVWIISTKVFGAVDPEISGKGPQVLPYFKNNACKYYRKIFTTMWDLMDDLAVDAGNT